MCSFILYVTTLTSVFQKLKKNKNMQKNEKKQTKKKFKSCKRLSQVVQRQSFLLQFWEISSISTDLFDVVCMCVTVTVYYPIKSLRFI